jgi:hypothetical protein
MFVLQFGKPANDNLFQIVAERKEVGVDGLGELRLDSIGLLADERRRFG